MRIRMDALGRGIGLVLGLAIALLAILAWRLPPGEGSLGADLVMVSGPIGELAVEPAGPFFSAVHMRPGPEADAASAELELLNKTARTLSLQMRVLPSDDDLNDVAWVAVSDGGRDLYRGPLGGLTSWTDRRVSLATGARTTLGFRAWIPDGTGPGYEGRIATVTVEFLPTVVDA